MTENSVQFCSVAYNKMLSINATATIVQLFDDSISQFRVEWLNNWQFDWIIDRLIDRLIDWLIDWSIEAPHIFHCRVPSKPTIRLKTKFAQFGAFKSKARIPNKIAHDRFQQPETTTHNRAQVWTLVSITSKENTQTICVRVRTFLNNSKIQTLGKFLNIHVEYRNPLMKILSSLITSTRL